MKTITEYTDLRVPDYALSYLVNGDASGLNDADRAVIDAWFSGFEAEAHKAGGYVIFNPGDGEASFTHCPEFGLACNCLDCTVIIVVSEKWEIVK